MSKVKCFDSTSFKNRFNPKEDENEQLVGVDVLNNIWKEYSEKVNEEFLHYTDSEFYSLEEKNLILITAYSVDTQTTVILVY